MKLTAKVRALELDTGSPSGIGHWSEVCPRRSELNRKYGGSGLGTLPMQIGSVVHALFARHFGGKPINYDKLRFKPQPDPRAERDGVATFRRWRGRFPSVSHFGTPKEVERLVDIKEDCTESFGVPYTCRIDLVTNAAKRISKALEDLYRVEVAPGYWIVDHKYHGSDWKFSDEPYHEGVQAIGYPLAYYWETGIKPQGTIFNHVFKTGGDRITVCPFPDNQRIESFIQWLVGAKRKQDATKGWYNIAACWYPVCIHRQTGNCKGV